MWRFDWRWYSKRFCVLFMIVHSIFWLSTDCIFVIGMRNFIVVWFILGFMLACSCASIFFRICLSVLVAMRFFISLCCVVICLFGYSAYWRKMVGLLLFLGLCGSSFLFVITDANIQSVLLWYNFSKDSRLSFFFSVSFFCCLFLNCFWCCSYIAWLTYVLCNIVIQ